MNYTTINNLFTMRDEYGVELAQVYPQDYASTLNVLVMDLP